MLRRRFIGGSACLGLAAACAQSRGGPTSSPASKPASAVVPPSSPAVWSELHGFCDGVEPTTPQEYAARAATLQASMRSASVDALVVEPGPNMTYLSGGSLGS